MSDFNAFLPQKINSGSWLTAHSLDVLLERVQSERVVLPICSLGTPADQLTQLAPLVLPPLYHEALDDELKSRLLDRIRQCFPFYQGTRRAAEYVGEFEIVELAPEQHEPPASPKVVAFSVDTAVEEHGPHLPLATDTIQSYAVLRRLAEEFDGFVVGPPVEYGHLTWGLPFGLSIDLTPELTKRYVTGFANAVQDWMSPASMYVVDVHGSIVHRTAIQDGLNDSRVAHHAFRWLHEPLVEFAADRGDQHAGGVETALVDHIDHELVDPDWWPERYLELANDQMSFQLAVDLTPDLPRFIEHVETHSLNGIVGDVLNFFELDPVELMDRMLETARDDVQQLVASLP